MHNAEIAQLVEHNLAKVGVASSSLVFRSKYNKHHFSVGDINAEIAQLVEHNLAPRIKDTNLGKVIIAEIAQLVEHNLAKVGVASSSLVFRSQGGLKQ